MNKPLRIGLTGAGDNATRRAAGFGIQETCANAEPMMAGVERDAIDIAAPRELPTPLVMETLRLVEDCYRRPGREALR